MTMFIVGFLACAVIDLVTVLLFRKQWKRVL